MTNQNTPNYPATLTKENFFDEMTKKYPKQMEVFCKWIDEYKKRVNWDLIFADRHNGLGRVPKFHEIPIAMQIGIITEFSMEIEPGGEAVKNDVVNGIESLISRVPV